MKTLALWLLLFASVSAWAQPRSQYSFETLTNLVATDPRSYTEGGIGAVMVQGRTSKHDWGAAKVWTYDRTSSAATNQWVVMPGTGIGRLSTVQTNDFFPLIGGSAFPIMGRMQFASPFATNQFIQFHYTGYSNNPPVGISAGLYGSGEHYLRFGSINTNTWNMLNSWLTIDGQSGAAAFGGSVSIGGVVRTNWPDSASNVAGEAITSGTINILRMPSGVATDAEVAAMFGSLTADNTWLGSQNFLGSVNFANLGVGYLIATNFVSTTWTNTGNAVVVGSLSAGSVLSGGTNLHTMIKAVESSVSTLSNRVYGDRFGFRLWDPLMNGTAASGDAGVSILNNGGTSGILASGLAGRPGVKFIRSTAIDQGPLIGWHGIGTILAPVAGSSERYEFEVDFRTPDTAPGQAGNFYDLQIGLNSRASGTNSPTDFVGLRYFTNIISGVQQWAAVTVSNSSSPTIIDTGVGYTNSAWYRMKVRLDSTNAVMTINGTPVATNSSASYTLPLGRALNAVVRLARTLGSTTLDVYANELGLEYSTGEQ